MSVRELIVIGIVVVVLALSVVAEFRGGARHE